MIDDKLVSFGIKDNHEPTYRLYDQMVDNFSMKIFLQRNVVVEGPHLLSLIEYYISKLIVSGSQMSTLWTRTAGERAKMNMGSFTDRRWAAVKKKIINGSYGTVIIYAAANDLNNCHSLSVSVNPSKHETLLLGEITLSYQYPCFKRFADNPENVANIIQFGKMITSSVSGKIIYGYANIGLGAPWWPEKLAGRNHAIPVAFTHTQLDMNIVRMFESGRGIKGAFWANFITEKYVKLLGGESAIRKVLPKCRIEKLTEHSLLILATDDPLPPDNEENRIRFIELHKALQPAFISLRETTAAKQELLGYFYRERKEILGNDIDNQDLILPGSQF